MKNSMILELVESNESYLDKINLLNNEEFKSSYDELFQTCEKLCENMPQNERNEIINKIFDAHCEMQMITEDEFFKEGFKLGFIIAVQNLMD